MFIPAIRRAIAAAVLIALTCPPPAFAAAELTTIRIGHNGFSSELPFYVGKDTGIFLNLEPIFILGGSTLK
jgi:ABC-type nitrate/sulfonate/bicarbonate transport system substrate-binding protein